MAAYINGTGMISPQKTAETPDFLSEIVETEADFLRCIDPVYRNYIDPIAGRRMSRLIKMGISAAKICVADAGIAPEAIITGTGLGSVEDTEKILSTMKEGENFFNPTPFIQSTYNTISSQIAINMKCHGYNSTYVHRILSFESSLIDALMQIEEGMASDILTGGVDEMTMNHLHITRKTGHWKMAPASNLTILKSGTPGAIAGEGAAWFMLSSRPGNKTYAKLVDVATYHSPDGDLVPENWISGFLEKNNLNIDNIGLILTGLNGDNVYDTVYYRLLGNLPAELPAGYFKHLCGEYHTASGFALWVASNILYRQEIPQVLLLKGNPGKPLKNILIYNQYRNVNHALMLVSALEQ